MNVPVILMIIHTKNVRMLILKCNLWIELYLNDLNVR
jgi:hypothetical protein